MHHCLLPETTGKWNTKLLLPCTSYITACYWKPQANEIRNYFSPARRTSLLATGNHRQMKYEITSPLHVVHHCLLLETTGKWNTKLLLPCTSYITACYWKPQANEIRNYFSPARRTSLLAAWNHRQMKYEITSPLHVVHHCLLLETTGKWNTKLLLPCTSYITACYWKPQANEIRNYFSPARRTSLLATGNHRQMKYEITSPLHVVHHCLLPETTGKWNTKLLLPCTSYITACCLKPQANEIRNYFSPARRTSLLAAWNHRQMKYEITSPLHVVHHCLLPETTGKWNTKLLLPCTSYITACCLKPQANEIWNYSSPARNTSPFAAWNNRHTKSEIIPPLHLICHHLLLETTGMPNLKLFLPCT